MNSALIGVVLALAICASAAWTGMGRERSFYPTVVMAIASYYVLFALMGGTMAALGWEIVAMLVFAGLAIAGYKTSSWLVVAALAAHGVFDLLHPQLFVNAGVPAWWPVFCLACDVVMAAWLAVQLSRPSPGPAS
ncbi:MAG: hypothetical protein V4631_20495 [Pseudomonadota bacterium]